MLKRNDPISYELELAAFALAPRFYASSLAPDTLEGITARAASGCFVVWDGASDKTIFSMPRANHSFRAWHDRAHVMLQAPLNREGEQAVLELQTRELRALFGDTPEADFAARVLYAEIRGQFDYEAANGRFPENQRAFVLAYLENQDDALAADF